MLVGFVFFIPTFLLSKFKTNYWSNTFILSNTHLFKLLILIFRLDHYFWLGRVFSFFWSYDYYYSYNTLFLI